MGIMGDLVVQQFVSADGYAANVRNEFDLFDRIEADSVEFDRRNLEWLESVGAVILGAETYRMFAGYWPTPAAEHEVVAPKVNSLPKYVFSRSLASAPWGDYPEARVESDDTVEAIDRIKGEVGGDLVLWGSLSLTASLLEAGAVDVVRLVLLPVAIGAGRGFFPDRPTPWPLRLLGSESIGPLVAVDYAVGA
jgi:dihydrofolate reductase